MPNRYDLPGFQVEPEAAFWLEGPNPLRVARIEEVIAYTEPADPASRRPMFAIDPVRDFPDTQPELIAQFVELVLLSLTRDRVLPTDDPARPVLGKAVAPGGRLSGALQALSAGDAARAASGEDVALADEFSGAAGVFSTDQDAARVGGLTGELGVFLRDKVREELPALVAAPTTVPAGGDLGGGNRPGGARASAGVTVLEGDAAGVAPAEDVARTVARLGRLFPARVTPLSAFLNLQPVPFGAIFNTTRPGSQVPVTDVLDQTRRIELPPAVILTGRELARAFENETPGLYHRHALNWLLFNRADVSPPRHARVWAALDMAIYSALGAAWHYKWHRAPFRYLQRPWEYNRFLDVLFDRVVNRTGSGDGPRRTCPEPTPGTPRHPAWPSGHSTYSAAASYVLEYFFAGEASLGRSYQQVLQAARSGPEFGPDWIALQLRRLANNIGEARLFAGVHWRGDHVAGQKIGRAAAQVIVDQLKRDCVPDFMLRDCPDGAGVTPPDPDALAVRVRAARATACPVDQDLIEQPAERVARGAAFRATSGTF